MKTSELIKLLNEQIDIEGDLEVMLKPMNISFRPEEVSVFKYYAIGSKKGVGRALIEGEKSNIIYEKRICIISENIAED